MPAEIARLTCPESGAIAEVAVSHGMNCFSWRCPFAGEPGGEPRELLWAEPGFADGDKRPSRSGIPLLAPFAGRIAGAALEWEDATYELEPTGGNGNAIHGFAMRSAWRTVEQSGDTVTADFQPSIDAPAALGQWPSDYCLRATYRVAGSKLVLDFSAKNVGERSMPFAFGTHAYFRLPLADSGDVATTVARAAIDREWLCNDLIPNGETREIGAGHALNAGKPLGTAEYDTPFRFVSSATTTEVSDPATGRTVRQTFDTSMRCCVVYTPGHREAMCLEPYTSVPDPIALTSRGLETGLITLQPGESYETSITLETLVETA